VFPRLTDLPADQFSTDFDTLELLNSGAVGAMLDKILPVWSSLTNQGLFRTAVGVSDAHTRTDPPGFAGPWWLVPPMIPPCSTERDLEQLEGPAGGGGRRIFLRISIGAATPGDTVTLAPPFEVALHVEAADWVPVEEVTLLANGAPVAVLPLSSSGQVDPAHPAVRFDGVIPCSRPRTPGTRRWPPGLRIPGSARSFLAIGRWA